MPAGERMSYDEMQEILDSPPKKDHAVSDSYARTMESLVRQIDHPSKTSTEEEDKK